MYKNCYNASTNLLNTWQFVLTETVMQQLLPVKSSFVGCIQDMKINDVLVPFHRSSGVFGPVNLKECPGWAFVTEQTLGPCPPPTMCNRLKDSECVCVSGCVVCVWMIVGQGWRDVSSSLQVYSRCCYIFILW